MKSSRCVHVVLTAFLLAGCDNSIATDAVLSDEELPDLRRGRGAAGIRSTFDGDTDGWTLFGDAVGSFGEAGNWNLQPGFVSGKGNPGGAIFADDASMGFTFFFQAPHRYLGNKPGYYGGSLSFDLRTTGGEVFAAPDVLMAGGGLTIVIDLDPDPIAAWTTYRVRLHESAGWRISNAASGVTVTKTELLRVLRDLNVLLIRGEHIVGGETGLLDNVLMRRRNN